MSEKSIKKNFIWNTLLKLSSIIFPLIIYPYVSRVIGVESIGRVSFATSVISYFMIISQLGIPTYGIRIIAQNADNKQNLSKNTSEILYINIFTTIIAYIVLGIMIAIVPRFHEDSFLLIITSLEMIFTTIGMGWLFSGLEQYSYITIRSLVIKLLSLVCIFIFVKNREDYFLYALILVLAIAGSGIINFFYSRKFVQLQRLKGLDYNAHIRPILVFFLMSVATTVYTSLDTIMLGFMTDNVAVGLYTSAIKVRSVLLGLVNALAVVVLPRASYYVKENKIDDFVRVSRKTFHFIILIALATWVYFSVFAKECILVLSGKEFLGATAPMVIIMPTVLVCGLSNLTAIQMLVALGKEKSVLVSQVIGAIIDFVLNFIFIPIYGASAAAGATLVAEVVILIIQVHTLHKMDIKLSGSFKYYRVVLSILIAIILCAWIKILDLNALVTLIISATIFFIVYAILLIAFKDSIAIEIFHDFIKKLNQKMKKNR